MTRAPALRRYLWRFIPLMLGYVVVLPLSELAMERWHPTGAALAALAVLPALPVVGMIVAMGLYLVEERDEFLRHRLVIAMLAGLGVLLVVATIWGFLQNGGAVAAPDTYLAFPLWCAAFGIAQGVMAVGDRRRPGA